MKPRLEVSKEGIPSLVFANGRRISTDLVHDSANYGKPLRGKQEIIAKACGISGKPMTILDATFGLGQDAWTLARLGCQVVGCEREPLLFDLFRLALERAKMDSRTKETADRIDLRNLGSEEILKNPGELLFSTVYLDPMFPDSKKSALPKIEMQLLREWLGHGDDQNQDQELLSIARAYPKGDEKFRVVVKRPLKSSVLAEDFFHQFKGKTIRYDCYKRKAR